MCAGKNGDRDIKKAIKFYILVAVKNTPKTISKPTATINSAYAELTLNFTYHKY